jgi:glycosyltransferase involved in cell wall biosynthesis
VKIDFWSAQNCAFDPGILWDRGLGGAEYALIFLAEELGKMGHTVTVWNSTRAPVVWGNVLYSPITDDYDGVATDLFVIFRVSLPSRPARAGRVVFLSCDQITDGGWPRMAPWLDRFVCISEFHYRYTLRMWPMFAQDKLAVCELGVNIPDYLGDPLSEKIPGRMIYCSIPHRGLQHLLRMWPAILDAVPNATLVVTSDYRLWGRGNDPGNHEFAATARRLRAVEFLGKVPRADLVRYQREAEVMAFPCVYDENFCIAAMECIAAGAVPVTFGFGAVPTTVGPSGIVIPGGPESPKDSRAYIDAVVSLATDGEMRDRLARGGIERARGNYSYAAVAERFLRAAGPVGPDVSGEGS